MEGRRLHYCSNMKVLHLINTLSVGGAELHLLTLCRHLKTQGVDAVIAYLKGSGEGSGWLRAECERQGVRSIDLLADRRYEWRVLGRIPWLLRAEQPDILHTHLPRADFARSCWGIASTHAFPGFARSTISTAGHGLEAGPSRCSIAFGDEPMP